MPKNSDGGRCAGDERWAHFRFSVVGPLLAAPPARGELKDELQRLAAKSWRHPVSGQWVRFGLSTIERWYYRAVAEARDPVSALSRKIREDQGSYPSLSRELREALFVQYRGHPSWSYQLHHDNLVALAESRPALGPVPSAGTVRRFMQAHGLLKRPRRGKRDTAGSRAAEARFEALEVRSYESEYPGALWHLDYHSGSLTVLAGDGRWAGVDLLAMLDDHSRLCAHAQWYEAPTAENLIHGLCQGFEKRGLPRALMTDNGSAMIAAETVQGLERLGIVHEKTLPYSAYQNGKQEVFWAQVEGRLLAMLEGCRDLSLAQLNEATQAWVELEYNRKEHCELKQTPLARYLAGKDVGRPSPRSEELRLAFTAKISRMQRRSDGTLTVEGVRFELPSRYRHLRRVTLRYAGWDLTHLYLADERTGQLLCRLFPQDKVANAEARRRRKEPLAEPAAAMGNEPPGAGGMAPLLRKLIAQYAATGIPPAYLPKEETTENKEKKS
jgi:transposase InsO family protein